MLPAPLPPAASAGILTLPAPPLPAAQRLEVEEALRLIEAAYNEIDSYRAHLVLAHRFLFFAETERAMGTVAFLKPGHLRRDITDPMPRTEVVTGGFLRILDLASGNVEEHATADWERLEDLHVPGISAVGGWSDSFVVSEEIGVIVVSPEGQLYGLKLVPLPETEAARRWASITLRLSQRRWFPADHVVLEHHDGNTIEISLENVVLNPGLKPVDFELPAPAATPEVELILPGAPRDAVVSGGSHRAKLYWNAPTSGGVPTSYVIQIGLYPGTAEQAVIDTSGPATAADLPWLPGGPYYLRVLATNAAGTSAPSNELRVEGEPQPFDADVARPAYRGGGPRVLFDEAHFNFFTTSGDGEPLVELLRNDGYRVTTNQEPFRRGTLDDHDILVVANAYGFPLEEWRERGHDWWKWSPESAVATFTEEEADAVREWVRDGGSLLLAAGNAPWAAAASSLASRFGVEMRNVDTRDASSPPQDEDFGPRHMMFFSDVVLLARQRDPQARGPAFGRLASEHPILRGRDETERIWGVHSYESQSLVGPDGSIALLTLPETATDWWRASPGAEWQSRPAAGRAHAVALRFGAGRVVVLGDAGMLMARSRRFGSIATAMGMAWPEDFTGVPDVPEEYAKVPSNRQFTLNVMHWLSGVLQ